MGFTSVGEGHANEIKQIKLHSIFVITLKKLVNQDRATGLARTVKETGGRIREGIIVKVSSSQSLGQREGASLLDVSGETE